MAEIRKSGFCIPLWALKYGNGHQAMGREVLVVILYCDPLCFHGPLQNIFKGDLEGYLFIGIMATSVNYTDLFLDFRIFDSCT